MDPKKTSEFLKKIFKEFYFKKGENIEVPRRTAEREFGYMSFDRNMTRHLSFQNVGDLNAFLVKLGPHSIFYSAAYYSEPSFPMNSKGWGGMDLIFDIDADMIPTKCKDEHDIWVCKDCNTIGKGKRPEICNSCKGNRINEEKWVCEFCLEHAKKEAIKLIDFLLEDLGILKEKMNIYFSGNRGYHLTVEESPFDNLDQMARNEIADYISGIGLNLEYLGIYKNAKNNDFIRTLPHLHEPGWRGRIANYLFQTKIGDNGNEKKDSKEKIIYLYNKLKHDKFKLLIQEIGKKIGAKIDAMVTTDVHRIFRLPGSLHGDSGFVKKRCHDILPFNPLIDAVVLGEEMVKVFVDHSPKFSLKEYSYGPYRQREVQLPLMAAVYLMCKGCAWLI